ncbi:hypothetical protein [Streptomyces sp. bgisy027]|uniref:hypothetical protein n=1 Tax=Streptomyces sp. bgisy027 TaxID=3413770 RepID=UPI003D719085
MSELKISTVTAVVRARPHPGVQRARTAQLATAGVSHASALTSIRRCEESRRFRDRERAEGRRRGQAARVRASRRPASARA